MKEVVCFNCKTEIYGKGICIGGIKEAGGSGIVTHFCEKCANQYGGIESKQFRDYLKKVHAERLPKEKTEKSDDPAHKKS